MPSTKEFKDFVLEQMGELKNVDCRPMMGEFLLYYNEVLFGGVYDNRLLVKITKTNKKYALCENLPYEKAKPMFLVEDLEDKEYLRDIIIETCKGLKKR